MNLDTTTIRDLQQRLANGEKITRIAKEVGCNWQKLWGILKAGKHEETRHQNSRQDFGSTGQETPRDPMTRCEDGVHRFTFEAVSDAIRDALEESYAQNETNKALVSERLRSHLSGSDRWANNFTRESLLAAIANPPAELLAAVDQMREELVEQFPLPTTARRKVRHGQEWGDELDSDKVLSRSYQPWDRSVREQHPQRTVTVGINLTVNCAQTAEHLRWRGAAALALADLLTRRGLNVEIIAFWSLSGLSSTVRRAVVKYVIKRSDMPMDTGAAAVALAEIAFARVIGLYGMARHVPGAMSRSLGMCEALPVADSRELDYLAEEHITNREAASEWLKLCVTEADAEVSHV